MATSLDIIFKSFLVQCPAPKQTAIFQYLSTDSQKIMEETPPAEGISSQEILRDGLLDFIHYSWFIPTLKTYSVSEISLFLLLFSPRQLQSLESTLGVSPSLYALSVSGKTFLQDLLVTSLLGKKKSLLPFEFLPKSPFNALLSQSKTEWTRLIDFLGLYDLVFSLSLIVETKLLKKIHLALNKEQKNFIQKKSAQKDPFAFPPLPLETWDGTPKSLSILLHKRGLNRLALALSNEHSDLIWYVCHILDIGRGSAIEKLSNNKAPLAMSEHIKEQILDLCKISGELNE